MIPEFMMDAMLILFVGGLAVLFYLSRGKRKRKPGDMED